MSNLQSCHRSKFIHIFTHKFKEDKVDDCLTKFPGGCRKIHNQIMYDCLTNLLPVKDIT